MMPRMDRLKYFKESPSRFLGCSAAVLALLLCGCSDVAQDKSFDAWLDEAWQDYRLQEFDQAVTAFVAALHVAEEPGESVDPVRQAEALYALGTIHGFRRPKNSPQLAREYLNRAVETTPESDWAAWSLLALARMEHLVPVGVEPDIPVIREAYQRVVDRFPYHPAGEEAYLFQQETYLLKDSPEERREVIENLQRFLKDHPESSYRDTAYDLLQTAFLLSGEPRKRLDALVGFIDHFDDDPLLKTDMSKKLWQTAAVAEFQVGDFDTARRYYRRLVKEFPTDQRVYGAQLALKRMDSVEATIREELAPAGGSAAEASTGVQSK